VTPLDADALPNSARVGYASGRFVADRASLKQLTSFAYSEGAVVPISGGPEWVDSALFTVDAVTDSNDIAPERMRAMVRTLLADQFGLRLRRESRLVYILRGPASGEQQDEAPRQSKQPMAAADAIRQRGAWLIGSGATTAQLASALSLHLSSPVLDHTSLRGTLDFRLKSSPGVGAEALARELRRQLGLTLQSFPREQLTIEQAERPVATIQSL